MMTSCSAVGGRDRNTLHMCDPLAAVAKRMQVDCMWADAWRAYADGPTHGLSPPKGRGGSWRAGSWSEVCIRVFFDCAPSLRLQIMSVIACLPPSLHSAYDAAPLKGVYAAGRS